MSARLLTRQQVKAGAGPGWDSRALGLRLFLVCCFLLGVPTIAPAQQEFLGLEARSSGVRAHSITVKDSKATIRPFGSISISNSSGYLLGKFTTEGEALLTRISRSSDRIITLAATNSRGGLLSSTLQLSEPVSDKLVALTGFDLSGDRVADLAIIDVKPGAYRWFIITNPLTATARQVRTFTLGSTGDLPDWFEAPGRSIRFVAVRHRSGSAQARFLVADRAGRAMRPISTSWVREFGAVTTSQMRLGYRKDLGLALESVSGDFVMVTDTSNHLIRSKTPPAFCSGVQQITRILRRGDVSAFESCPDGRFIVSRRGYNKNARDTQVLQVGSLTAPLYFMRRGDRTDLGDSGLAIGSIPTPGPGAIVIPDPSPSPTPTASPTPTPTPMNTDVLLPQVRYTTFPGESDVEVADYNRDGFLDIASAAAEGRVDLLLGVGDGTFIVGTPFSAARANFLESGDLNGDGSVDLVVADYINGALYSYLGQGNGSFIAGGMVDAPGGSQGVELADLNSDGKLDAACVSGGANTLTIFFGNGDGTFTLSQNLVTGNNSFTLKLADLNRDSRIDIAVADSGSNTLSIFLNLGGGTFGSRTVINAGPAPDMSAIGDLNNDGKLDLVVTNLNGQRFELFLGRGDGTFDEPSRVATNAGPFGAALTDFNRDGRLDLAINSLSSDKLDVFLGNGNGTFQVRREYASTSSPRYLDSGDFNRDSYPDLAVAQYTTGTIGVFLAKPNASP